MYDIRHTFTTEWFDILGYFLNTHRVDQFLLIFHNYLALFLIDRCVDIYNISHSQAGVITKILTLIKSRRICFLLNEGQRIDTACQDMITPMTKECETQFLAGDITLTFQQENSNIYQKSCQEKFIEKDLNTFCRTFHRSDPCKFRVLDFMTKYKNCIVSNKNISVTYDCISKYFILHVYTVKLHWQSSCTMEERLHNANSRPFFNLEINLDMFSYYPNYHITDYELKSWQNIL